MDIVEIARDYISRGWAIVPIPYKKKSPVEENWQTLPIDSTNVSLYFKSPSNIGVQLGPRSGGLVDIDLDCEEARVLAHHFLPKTEAIFGRHSNPSSHWLYRLSDDTEKAVFKFLDPDTKASEIVALRTGGGKNSAQTVFPGSTHEGSGELIEWVNGGTPAEIGFEPLIKAGGHLAVASLALRNWPSRGRHEITLRLSGILARANWEAHEIMALIEAVATEAGDDEVENRIKTAKYVCDAWAKNENVYGLPALKEVIGEKHSEFIAKWAGYSDDNNNALLDEMNEKYCVLQIGAKARVLNFEIREGRKFALLYSFEDFKNLLNNQKIFTGTGTKVKATGQGTWWLNNTKRRQVNGIVFRPGQPPEINGYINLWQGFAVEPKQGNWDLIRNHVSNVLANNDATCYEYIYRWCCWTLQNPGDPPGVALVFKGGKGTGKSFFGTALAEIFGQHGLHISSHDQLAGRFNAHLMDCSLLFADEAYWPGDRANLGNLRRMITESTLHIEKKGLDTIEARNCLHLIMATNEDWVVPASLDERRFAIFNVSEDKKQKKAYFDPLYKQRANGGLGAMMHDMINFDLDGWHPRNSVPKTAALVEQQLQSLSYEDQWWFELLQEGSIPGSWENPKDGEYNRVTIQALLENFKISSPRGRNLSTHLLSRYLQSIGCVSGNDGKKRYWQLPKLLEARAKWTNILGVKWDDNIKWVRWDVIM